MSAGELGRPASDRSPQGDRGQEMGRAHELGEVRPGRRDYLTDPPTAGEIELQRQRATGERRWSPYDHRWVEGMPGAERASVDVRKFRNYSMDPGNENNGGKHKAWEQLGYDVSNEQTRQELSIRVKRMVQEGIKTAEVEKSWDAPNGRKYRIPLPVEGAPDSDKRGTLQTVWLRAPEADAPRLITNWLEVHRDDKEDR